MGLKLENVKIAGCFLTKGKFAKGMKFKIIRNGKVI